jgi:hypothetical protein
MEPNVTEFNLFLTSFSGRDANHSPHLVPR